MLENGRRGGRGGKEDLDAPGGGSRMEEDVGVGSGVKGGYTAVWVGRRTWLKGQRSGKRYKTLLMVNIYRAAFRLVLSVQDDASSSALSRDLGL